MNGFRHRIALFRHILNSLNQVLTNLAKKNKRMKIRWRLHEVLFVTFTGLIFTGWFGFSMLEEARRMLEMEGIPDASWSLIISYSIENLFVPQIGPLFITYLLYLASNLYIIPQLVNKRKGAMTGILISIGVWLILLFMFAFTYYERDFYNVLQRSMYSGRRRILQTRLSMFFFSLLLYAVYLVLREQTIKWLDRRKNNRVYAVTLCNNITGVLFLYLALMVLLYLFDFFRGDGLAVFYVFFLLPAIVVCFINIYGLFPAQKKWAMPFRRFFWRLTLAPTCITVVVTIVFLAIESHGGLFFALLLWGALMLIATPLSWLLYIQQREKLESMLNLQLSLGNTSANLQFLRSQINPHFLFNALNTIYGTALQENAERTSEAVQRLGDMMRFMLEENQQDRISLDKEMAYLTNYIDLQKLRTSVSPDIDISFTNNTKQCNHHIAPMLLIPFVENAFKHGISLKEKSWIRINISCDTETIYFDVYNSVHPRSVTDPEKNRSGIGLENVKQRLSLIYPHQHELHIRSTSTEYFVHLTLKS